MAHFDDLPPEILFMILDGSRVIDLSNYAQAAPFLRNIILFDKRLWTAAPDGRTLPLPIGLSVDAASTDILLNHAIRARSLNSLWLDKNVAKPKRKWKIPYVKPEEPASDGAVITLPSVSMRGIVHLMKGGKWIARFARNRPPVIQNIDRVHSALSTELYPVFRPILCRISYDNNGQVTLALATRGRNSRMDNVELFTVQLNDTNPVPPIVLSQTLIPMNIEIGDLWIGDEYLIAVFEHDPRLILADRSGHSGCILRAYDYEPADFHLVYWKAEMQPRSKIMVLQEVVASYFLIAEVPSHIPLVNPTANSRSPDRWTTLPMVILRTISVSPSAQLFLPPSQSWPSLSFPYCVVTGLPKTAPELSSEQDSCGPSFEAQWYSVPKDGDPVPISNKALVLDYEQRDLLVEFCGISIIGSRTVVFPFNSFDFKKLCSKELDVGDYTRDPSMTMFATIIRGFDPVYGRLIIESGSGVGWGEGEALDVLQF